VSTTSTTPERMVIAIDPHKASWTAAVVDASLQPVATIRVPVSRDGYRALRRFANRWPDPTWAIEGASGLGAPLTARLRTDGIDVVDVPAKLAARVRMLSTGHGRKNDDADAVSVAIAARSAPRLNSAAVDGAVTALRAIVEHRDDLVKTRNQTVNRLHVVLTNLTPAGANRDLTAERPPNSCAGSVPAMQPAKPCEAWPPISSLRYASWTAASPKPPLTYRPQSPNPAPLRPVRYRLVDRRQDPRPGRHDRSFPLRRRVRHLHRHSPDRRVLRKCCPP
jgi:hypothetical protein